MRDAILIMAAVTLAMTGCLAQPSRELREVSLQSSVIMETGKNPVKVDVELAQNPVDWQRGLMFRESLGENAGMLFIYPQQLDLTFWMKNTVIPLDMIFIDSNFTIIRIHRDVQPCTTNPCPLYYSGGPAQYVLEVNGGFSDQHGIKEGQKVIIND